MTVTYGSRTLTLDEPSPQELRQMTGFNHLQAATHSALLEVFEAGAVAVLREIENTRGARMERALLEDGR